MYVSRHSQAILPVPCRTRSVMRAQRRPCVIVDMAAMEPPYNVVITGSTKGAFPPFTMHFDMCKNASCNHRNSG